MKSVNWLGQATTGAGFATILAAFSGISSGSLDWQQAIPLLLGGVAGMAWPENPRLSNETENTVRSVADLVTAYRNLMDRTDTAGQGGTPSAPEK